jgi:hypothetical protein
VRASERDRALPIVLISAAPLERPADLPDAVAFDEVALKSLSATALTDILQRHLDLVWEYVEADPESVDAGCADQVGRAFLSLPPAGCCDLKLARFNEMLSLGAVVAIDRWAVEMAETYREYSSLWNEIRCRATGVDLEGLRDLAARLQMQESRTASP